MADEFIKGLTALMAGGLGWMTIAGWYRTPSFEGDQLIAPVPTEGLTVYDQLALILMDVSFWFAVFGALTFWVLIPVFEEAREAWAERSN